MRTRLKPMIYRVLWVLCLSARVAVAAQPPAPDEAAARKAYTDGQYELAAIKYQRLLQVHPADDSFRLRLAECYEFQGDVPAAMQQANRVLSNQPNNSQALKLMARMSGREDDWPAAARYYQRAVKLDKEDAGAQLGLGQALMQLGNDQAAEKSFAEYRRVIGTTGP